MSSIPEPGFVKSLRDQIAKWSAEFPGGLGQAQQAKHMAVAAVECLNLVYENTSPIDIQDAIAKRDNVIAARDRELAQLKADKDEMVRRNAVLRTRHDLPVDRVQALDSFIAERDAANLELAEAIEFVREYRRNECEHFANQRGDKICRGCRMERDVRVGAFLARHAPTNKETPDV